MENKPFFARVIIRKAKAVAEANIFEKNKNEANTFEIVAVGNDCADEVKAQVGRMVLIADSNAQKLREDETWIYYVVSQESLLVY